MAQLFTPASTTLFRDVIVLVLLAVVGSGAVAFVWVRSDGAWNVGKPASQPVPFRHDVHSGSLKIDCRYCHASVTYAADAGMPAAETCMTCHSQVWNGASILEPIRTSAALGQAVRWTSLYRLPDYVYFHHAVHVTRGVACETCHGRVDRMAETVKAETMSMSWCLDCHRDPAPKLRPPEAVFTMGYENEGEASQHEVRSIHSAAAQRLTSCNTCHR